MKSFFYIVIVSFVICLAGCDKKTTTGDILTLDLEAAIDNTRTLDLAEISDDIEFVALDNDSREALVGDISNIKESQNGWYVLDGGMRPFSGYVKLFDRQGKFISTRGVIGRGPNEFSNISSIAIDWERDNVYLYGRGQGNPSILAYDSDGRLFARADSVPGSALSYHNDHLIMFERRPAGKPEPSGGSTFLNLFSPDLKRVGSIEILDKGRAESFITDPRFGRVGYYFSQGFISDNGKSLIVKETLCDTVFLFSNEKTLEPAYVLDLGKYTPPAETLGENATIPWSDNFCVVTRIWEGDRYMLIRVSSANSHLIFDRDASFAGFSAVGPDGKQGLFIDGIAFTPSYIRDNRLVGYLRAFDIVNNAEGITNPDFAALAAKLKEDSNPVIVVAHLKK